MKVDKNGLFYFDDESKGKEIVFTDLPEKNKPEDINRFYELIKHPELIIKCPINDFNQEDLRKMIERFRYLQSQIHLTDLPLFCYQEYGSIRGMVTPYYKDGISLYSVKKTRNLDVLMKYYKRDDDKLHNLYLLLQEIIDILEELYDNGICYYDSNTGNFILVDNTVKLIDFSPKYLRFDKEKKHLRVVLCGINKLAYLLNASFCHYDMPTYNARSFNRMRKHLEKEENRLRMR